MIPQYVSQPPKFKKSLACNFSHIFRLSFQLRPFTIKEQLILARLDGRPDLRYGRGELPLNFTNAVTPFCNCSPSRGTSCRMAHRFCRKTRPPIWSLGSHTSPYARSSFEGEHLPRTCKAGRFSWIFLLEVASAGYCHAYTMLKILALFWKVSRTNPIEEQNKA